MKRQNLRDNALREVIRILSGSQGGPLRHMQAV